MRYKSIHKIVSFFMAFVVLFSTLSFAVEKHFCGTHLVDTAIFFKAKKCGMEMSSKTAMKKNCCKNEIEIVKGQDELKSATFDDLDFIQHHLFTTFIYTYANLFESLPKQIIPHKEYSPPDLIIDIQLLDDVFLI